MKYAKIIHAELPLPLMVHVRAKRWALTMARYRPIELWIPEPGRLAFTIRANILEIDGQYFTEGATAEVIYRLERDDLGEYGLVRLGDIRLNFDAPGDARDFFRAKLEAFFGPVLTGGGVVIPEGGLLGVLRHLKSQCIRAEREWIVVGWEISSEVIEAFSRSGGESTCGG
jgi:hypothetical protein